ncbi:MAG: hypothetical protein FWC39_12130 [Bacteroidetes bacterium]|nr:hypothetical protein [Bacteroidota bacterium]MCL2329243.1 hypothetical protein [Bacteroidota bacterium]
MKAVMIIFSQAHTERVEYIFNRLEIKGFTYWENVQGEGSKTGEPHRGTHTWPEMNNSILTVVEDDRVHELLVAVRKLDNRSKDAGIRAFVWNIEQAI